MSQILKAHCIAALLAVGCLSPLMAQTKINAVAYEEQGQFPEIVLRTNSNAAAEKSYASVYESIPFNRAEYEANPGYRHDTTMEILFGKLRDTVIYQNYSPRPIINSYRLNDYGYSIYPYYRYRSPRGFYTNRYNYYYLPPRIYRNY